MATVIVPSLVTATVPPVIPAALIAAEELPAILMLPLFRTVRLLFETTWNALKEVTPVNARLAELETEADPFNAEMPLKKPTVP